MKGLLTSPEHKAELKKRSAGISWDTLKLRAGLFGEKYRGGVSPAVSFCKGGRGRGDGKDGFQGTGAKPRKTWSHWQNCYERTWEMALV